MTAVVVVVVVVAVVLSSSFSLMVNQSFFNYIRRWIQIV